MSDTILETLTPFQKRVLAGLSDKYRDVDPRFNTTELFPIEEIDGPHGYEEKELRVAKAVHNTVLENAGKKLEGGWK